MGFVSVTSSGPDLAALADDARRRVEQAGRSVGGDLADAGRDTILDSARRRWGSLSLSGLHARLDVTARPSSRASGSIEVTLEATPAAAWAIVEDGSGAHRIVARSGHALRTRRGFYASVRHPGTAGTRAWTAAEEDLDRDTSKMIEDSYDTAMGV